MAETLLPGWTTEAERAFKEVLFRFLEEVHCTKAALYLLAPGGVYVLVAQYGFGRRDRLAAEHRDREPLVTTVKKLRVNPLAVNDASELPAVSDYLLGAGTQRMMLVPLRGAARTLGFVDARDKGGRRPFEDADLRQASIIATGLLRLLQKQQLYPDVEVGSDDPAVEPPRVLESASARAEGDVLLDVRGLCEINEAAAESVLRQEVLMTAVTIAAAESAATVVFAAGEGEDPDTDSLLRHQAEAVQRVGLTVPRRSLWRVDLRRTPVPTDERISGIVATAVPVHAKGWALVVSAVGGEDVTGHLDRLRRISVAAHDTAALRFARRSLARRLLQPGETRYPDLLAHSLAVSRLSWLLAEALEMDERNREEAALAGLLHDIGMRELDYDRLYRHPSPGPEDRRTYQRHPVVGERIVQGTGLDGVARAIRSHHERWDGKGYPDRIHRDDIPLLARIVHVAEVFDVLTSASSYRPNVTVDRALDTIRSAAEQQFDPALVQVLAGVVS